MSSLRKIEWGLAIVATTLAIYFHLVFFKNAGALWRDEINSVSIANLGSIADVWRHIEFDSFPIFWLLVLHSWSLFIGSNDLLYRFLGFGIGISVLAALWFNARVFKISYPMVSIVLLGFSPAIIRWGDAMRGYGLGISAILFTFGLVWKVIELPSAKNVALATLSALVAAQSLYYNSVLIFAICLGGFAVAVINQAWRRLFPLALIGGVSALSLLPYFAVFERSKSWGPMFRYPELWQGFRLNWFWQNLSAALNATGPGIAWIWIGLFALALGSGVLCLLRKKEVNLGRNQRDLAVFSLTTLIVGLVAYYLFLKRLQYPTQTWYYVALIAFTAVAIDVLLSLFNRWKAWRIFVIGFLAVFIALTFSPVRSVVHTRMTNLDLVAAYLKQNSAPGDFIIVTPWYGGITFDRYYHADALWMTIPPIEDHRFHRVDLLKNYMTAVNQADPVRPILEKAKVTLKEGHKVWIVGNIRFLERGQIPPLLLPAPNEESGWHDLPYVQAWALQVGYFVQTQSLHGHEVSVPVSNLVNEYENFPLVLVEGWNAGG